LCRTARSGGSPSFTAAEMARNPRSRHRSFEKLRRGERVNAFCDQFVTTTLASSGAARSLELLLETRYRGVIHLSDASVLDRVDFARRVAERFGLHGTIVPVKTADVRLAAPRPLRGGLRVEKATRLLKGKPLPIEAALEAFYAEWVGSSTATV
jgi:dTDP-4-dehydrorhamnose reductase